MRQRLVAALERDYGGHPYGKWRGAFWRLVSLAELGAAGHAGVLAAAEDALRWLANPRRLGSFPTFDGRVRRCASQDGLALFACCRVGVPPDDRLRAIAESLVKTQWPDGGWNCDRRPEASHSSFNETWGPIAGLAAYARATDDDRARVASERGADLLLRHRVYQSHRTGEPAHPAVLNLRYPAYWHYDVRVGLTTLERSVGLADPRTADALDLLESKRRPDGTWRTEGRLWKRPGAKGSNVEVVDWGEMANELLTERALSILRAAGRL